MNFQSNISFYYTNNLGRTESEKRNFTAPPDVTDSSHDLPGRAPGQRPAHLATQGRAEHLPNLSTHAHKLTWPLPMFIIKHMLDAIK